MNRDLVLKIALQEVGTKEFPDNSNNVKYNTWFYDKAVSGKSFSWCGAFVSWVFFTAGIPLGIIDYRRGFASCYYAATNIHKWGHQITVPSPGDIVLFDWDGNGVYDHTGIFIKDLGGGLFQSIEGNTSLKNQSNGGEVMLRSDRKYKNAIFVRPNAYKENKPQLVA